MRGKRLFCNFVNRRFGITPADAGKTRFRPKRKNKPQDHPRGCGENCRRRLQLKMGFRITPADAGKTF